MVLTLNLRRDMLEHLISENELAERLDKTKQALQAWRSRGQGPPWLKLVGSVFYDRRKVDEWIAAQERVPTRAAS
jgi:hypothetical protein